MDTHEQERRIQTACLLVVAAVALGFALYWLSPVLIPFLGPLQPTLSTGVEGTDPAWNRAGVLHQAGVVIAMSGPDLLEQARFAVRFGLPEDDALRAITITPARLLGIEDRVGSLAVGQDADLVLVSGGSSVGQEDHAPQLLAELGSLDYHGISMRPSSPAGVGRIGDHFVFLLPGNPVSCLCAYEFFAGPTLRALGGRSREWPHRRVRLPLKRKISSAVGRTDYVRVAVEAGQALPLATSGASILSSTVRASGSVIVPRELEGMPEGAEVEVLLYD